MRSGDVPAPARLPLRDVVLLTGVAALWGFNFVPIRWALDEIPPFLLSAVRFVLAAIPLVFFVRRPRVPFPLLAAYGLAIGVGQFGLLFLAIHSGLPAGLASLLIQVQVFFTIGLASFATHDRLALNQLAGACIAALGLTAIVAERVAIGETSTWVGLGLVLAAAASWAVANVIAKVAARRHGADMFGLVVWSSLAAPLPLGALSYALEGGEAAFLGLKDVGVLAWASVGFMAYGATLFGFAAWNRILHRHPAGLVTPFALLVPIAGLASAALLLGESLSRVEVVSAIAVLTGLAVTLLGRSPTPGPSVVPD